MPPRPSVEQLLAEYGERPRLVVYLSAAPGSGKTRRLLLELHRLRSLGRDAIIGWIETKGRADLERLAEGLPRIPPREVVRNGRNFLEFDFEAALARRPQVIALDEVAHANLPGSRYAMRWEEALALRDAGISVLCAFNIAHLESVAPAAERLTGHALRAIVPDRFLESADEVVAFDVSPQLVQSRLRSGKIVSDTDVDAALQGVFSDRTLYALRELLLHAVDHVTQPNVSAERVSTAVVFVPADIPVDSYVERAAAVAGALDLRLEIRPAGNVERSLLDEVAVRVGAEILSEPLDPLTMDVSALRASLIVLPNGKAARHIVNRHQDRDILVIDPSQVYLGVPPASDVLGAPQSDGEAASGYGRLTVYLGSVAGSGKTYAMLDRAHQLKGEGIDVIAGFIETHGRAETAALIEGIEVLPREVIVKDGVRYEELDRDAVIERHPQVVLIDELAHTNAPGSAFQKRYEDVLAILRAGIDVITTLNIQHLEALNDTVFRLTQTVVRETLPDGILAIANEVILIDVTPQTLRARLREGKIYPPERIERALANFFTLDNLTALRELALREALRARIRKRPHAPFEQLLLCAGPRNEDVALVRRCSQIAARMGVRLAVAMITEPRDRPSDELTERLRLETEKNHATWHQEMTHDAPRRIIELARMEPETVVAMATTLRHPRWPQRNAFARRVLDAGAREVLVLTRRGE
ncbi:MAG: histidine kinase [Candidatus Eremiobacteraeota bacterium]|nr:histidine kinase [Candidatus Eremiobacteraeota bacterium]